MLLKKNRSKKDVESYNTISERRGQVRLFAERLSAKALLGILLVAGAISATLFVAYRQNPLGNSRVASTGPCLFQMADQPTAIAFCDTFDQPMGTGNRSGDLNGEVWGVSRSSSSLKNWFPTKQLDCGATNTVLPPKDIKICNGRLIEAVNDGGQPNTVDGDGAATVLGIYPKQPFDFAGRTGTITFDVTADSRDSHQAWPAFAITDLPVPAPNGGAPGVNNAARNGFGFIISKINEETCSDGQPKQYITEIYTTKNYDTSLVYNNGNADTDQGICPPKEAGNFNHFEIRMNQNDVEIYGTDAGSTVLKHMVSIKATLPLTRGLIWLEDEHYNACKDFGIQCDWTFAWDNVGFDGPILSRDLANDVNDNTIKNSDGSQDIGWDIPSGSLALNVPNVSNISNATAALLTLNFFPQGKESLTYRVNGNTWHTQSWPFPDDGSNWTWRTIALPVALSEIVNGTNKVEFQQTSNQTHVANVDLVLVGAGGVPTCLNPSNCSGTPTPSPSPTPTPTPAPTPSPTPSPSPTPTPAPTPTPTPSGSVLLGDKTIESDTDANKSGQGEAFSFTAGASGKATKLSMYLDSASTATQVNIGIYADANSKPGTRLRQGTITAPAKGAWNTINISSLALTKGTTYWIAVLAPSGKGLIQFRDKGSGGVSYTSSQTGLKSLPSTWSNGQAWPSASLSAYAQ